MAAVIILDFNMLVFQLTLVFICSVISIAIMHGLHIFISKKKTKLETFNEFFVLLTMYNFVGFEAMSNLIDGPFLLGYLAIGLVSLHILVNILLIVR